MTQSRHPKRSDISSLAIVDSWARTSADTDSDLDLMLLVNSSALYRSDSSWLSVINWQQTGFRMERFEDVDYGAVWSRHIQLNPFAEVGLTFGTRTWDSVDPVDDGTMAVIANGCRILFDKEGLLQRCVLHIRRKRNFRPLIS